MRTADIATFSSNKWDWWALALLYGIKRQFNKSEVSLTSPRREKTGYVWSVLCRPYMNFDVLLFVLSTHQISTDHSRYACLNLLSCSLRMYVCSSYTEPAWNSETQSFDSLLAGETGYVLGQQRVRGGRQPGNKFWNLPNISTFLHHLCCSALGIVKWNGRKRSRWVR